MTNELTWDYGDDGYYAEAQVGDVRYIARVKYDNDPFPPEFDYGCPVFELEYGWNWGQWSLDPQPYGEDSARHDGLPMDLEEAFTRVHERWDKDDTLAILNRWLRMFHGGSIAEKSAYADREEIRMVTYDTRAMREFWGQTGDMLDTSAPDPGEWVAYREGDVYYFTVERALVDDDDDTEPDWEELDACHGFYGESYAKSEAMETLTHYVQTLPNVAIVETREVPAHAVTTRRLPDLEVAP